MLVSCECSSPHVKLLRRKPFFTVIRSSSIKYSYTVMSSTETQTFLVFPLGTSLIQLFVGYYMYFFFNILIRIRKSLPIQTDRYSQEERVVQMKWGYVKILLTLRGLLPSPLIDHSHSLVTVIIDKDEKEQLAADLGFISEGQP